MLRVGVVAGFGRSNWLTPGKETGAVVRLPASEVVGTCGREFPSPLRWSPGEIGGDALHFQDTDKWMEQSVFRVPMATRGMEGVTLFADLPSCGATRCIVTGVSPDQSVYVTVNHGGVDLPSVDLKLP